MGVPVFLCLCGVVTTFGVVTVLDFGHPNRCVVVSHCCFNLHFPDDICEAYFICLFAMIFSSLVGYLLRSLAHILFKLFVFNC